MSEKSAVEFSGRGESEFEIPDHLVGRALLAETWGGLLGKGFFVNGEGVSRNSRKREKIGNSAWGRERTNMFIPAKYSRLTISGGVHSVGAWNVVLRDVSQADELGDARSATASRIFSYPGGKWQADVEFGGRGCVAMHSIDGSGGQNLISHEDKFSGTINLPKKPGLLVVSATSDSLGWGSMCRWRIKLRPR
ncbi:hypothetical protein GCM10010252_10220 [Streptomyces aureoverticillatus]|nr:hypothetical protein GCM10010252_10220 [Streptomyces aureoverticillatus]